MQLHRQLLLASLLLGGVALAGAWQGPSAAAPGGNAAAPVNVSAAAQSKLGTVGVGGLGVFGRALVTPAAGYSLPANLQLGVNGAVGAAAYCDAAGQNCVTTLGGVAVGGGGSATGTAAASGDRIVCGGWDTKYGAGLVAGSAWGCASPASAPVCPAGYDTISSSHATINLAEHTNLCVLSRAGGGASSSQIIPGWPNFISCSAGDVTAVFTIQARGYINPGEVAYVMPTYDGSQPMLFFDERTRNFKSIIAQGTMGPAVSAAIESCKTGIDSLRSS